jgi:hypothetical protein
LLVPVVICDRTDARQWLRLGYGVRSELLKIG